MRAGERLLELTGCQHTRADVLVERGLRGHDAARASLRIQQAHWFLEVVHPTSHRGEQIGIAAHHRGYIVTVQVPVVQRVPILPDRDGSLWVATSGGLHRSRGSRWESLTAADGLKCDPIHTLYESDDGARWIGSGGGL